MDEDQIRQLLLQQFGNNSIMPMDRFLSNMAMTSPDFEGPIDLRNVQGNGTGPVAVADATPKPTPRRSLPAYEVFKRLFTGGPVRSAFDALVPFSEDDMIPVPAGADPNAHQLGVILGGEAGGQLFTGDISGALRSMFGFNIPFVEGGIEDQVNDTIFNMSPGAIFGDNESVAAPTQQSQAPTAATSSTPVASSPAPVPARTIPNLNAVAPAGLQNPTAVVPTSVDALTPPNISVENSRPGFGTVLNALFETPAFQQFLGELAVGLDPSGVGGILGQGAINRAQGQIIENIMAGSQNAGLGATSTLGATPETIEQIFRQQLQTREADLAERQVEVAESAEARAEELDPFDADTRRINALANLLNSQAALTNASTPEGVNLEGWQWNGIRQTVANMLYPIARQNLIQQNPGLGSIMELNRYFASEAGGIDPDKVFTSLTPQQLEEANRYVAESIHALERGMPFGSVLQGKFDAVQTPTNGPAAAGGNIVDYQNRNQVMSLPDGTKVRYKGKVYTKTAEGLVE